MPIKVACHCGASFSAKDELAGQTLLCPKCHQPLTISPPQQARASNGMDDLFEDVGLKEVRGPRCPQCGVGVQPNAVLCVQCGYNLQTGEKIQGLTNRSSSERGHGEASDTLLERAAQRIEEEKLEDKKQRAQGTPIYILVLGLVGMISFVATMFLLPRELAFFYCGGAVAVLGLLMSVYYGIRILIVAFSESVWCGLAFFIPVVGGLYSLYYIITRWDQAGGFFIMQLLGNFLWFAGVGMVTISPNMAVEKEDQVFLSAPAPDLPDWNCSLEQRWCYEPV